MRAVLGGGSYRACKKYKTTFADWGFTLALDGQQTKTVSRFWAGLMIVKIDKSIKLFDIFYAFGRLPHGNQLPAERSELLF